jgi:hypothetical protein
MSQSSSATTVARLRRGPSSTGTTTLPAFADLGEADAVGRHYALVYIAYQAARTSRAAA